MRSCIIARLKALSIIRTNIMLGGKVHVIMKRHRDIASYSGKKKVLPEPQSDSEYLSSFF